MASQLSRLGKFLALVVILNIIRYILGWPFERLVIIGPLTGAMERTSYCFNTHFSSFDWATSFFYNFMMWLTLTWMFAAMHSALSGDPVLKSLKIFGMGYLLFASISAIYMNHYRHPKVFYFYNILDGLLVFPLVAAANGLLYPLLFRKSVGAPER